MELVFSVVTAIIAIIALFQTRRQIMLSNKQFLFDKRLEKYILTKGLIELYAINKELLDYSKVSADDRLGIEFPFFGLTNNTFLKDMGNIIKDPNNEEDRINFLIKIEDMKKMSEELKFLFQKKIFFLLRNEGLYLSDFIMKYQNLLMELYKYRIIQYSILNDNIPRIKKTSYAELQKEYGESEFRKTLIKAVDELERSYQMVINKNSIKKIEKMIML